MFELVKPARGATPARSVFPHSGGPLLAGSTATPGRMSREEERRLHLEYARTRDLDLRNELVRRHEGLVRYAASRFAPVGPTGPEDIMQVAYIGLIEALERYDPSAGTSFTTFAIPTMLGSIMHYLRDQTWALKAPRGLRELACSLRKLRDRLEQRLGRTPDIAEMAREARVSEERLLEAMEVEQVYQPASLDAETSNDDGEDCPSIGTLMGVVDEGYRAVEVRETVRAALARLDERERTIIRRRFLDEATQSEVAAQLGISQMHVSRLERRALAQMREALG